LIQIALNEQRFLSFSFGLISEANQESRVVERLEKPGQKCLRVFPLLAIAYDKLRLLLRKLQYHNLAQLLDFLHEP